MNWLLYLVLHNIDVPNPHTETAKKKIFPAYNAHYGLMDWLCRVVSDLYHFPQHPQMALQPAEIYHAKLSATRRTRDAL